MLEKCVLIALVSTGILGIYALAMCAVPGKGWLHAAEKLCSGIILCFLLSLVFKPIGIQITNSPLAAAAAGWLGIPGAALAAFLSRWP